MLVYIRMGYEDWPIAQEIPVVEETPLPDILPVQQPQLDVEQAEKDKQNPDKTKEDLAVRDFSKAYHHPGYRTGVAEQIIEARKTGQDAEAVRDEFYQKTADEKVLFESQEKERSVSEIMKEKDLIFVHGMKMFPWEERGSDYNNQTLNNRNKNLGFEETYKIIAGLEPTISASVPSSDRSDNGMMKKWGILLGEGKILSAKGQDSRSEAFGIDKRIPKSDNEEHKHSAIQPKINIDKVVPRASDSNIGARWNELVIKNPEIAGLYYDMTIKTIDPNEQISKLREEYGYNYIDKFDEDFRNLRKTQDDERHRRIQEVRNSALGSEEIMTQENEILSEYYEKERIEEDKLLQDKIANVPEEYLKKKAEDMRNDELKEQKRILMQMKEYSDKMQIPIYALKNENNELKKYRINFEEGHYSKAYLRYVEYGNNPDELPDELKKLKYDYTMNPVSATDILESKRDLSNQERIAMIKEVKDKGIFSGKVEKEVESKLANLEKSQKL